MTETVSRHVRPASSPLSHWTCAGPDVISYTCDLPPSAFKISVHFRCQSSAEKHSQEMYVMSDLVQGIGSIAIMS